MVAIGIILAVAGACLWFGGIQVNSDIKRQWSSYWDSGSKDATGDMMIFFGVALVIVGAILLIYGLYKNSKNPVEENIVDENKKYRCSNCGSEIEGGDYWCPHCDMRIDWNSAVSKDSEDETPIEVIASMFEEKASPEVDKLKIIEYKHLESTKEEPENKYCTNCGSLIIGAGKFCAKCGMKVE